MRMELPVCREPLVDTFFHHEVVLAILQRLPEAQPWIFSSFIQLYGVREFSWEQPCFIDFFHGYRDAFRGLELHTNPWLTTWRFPMADVKRHWGGAVPFVIDRLGRGQYVGLSVRTAEISNYAGSGITGMHNMLVIGVDHAARQIIAMDHFRDGKLARAELPWAQVEASTNYSPQEELGWGNLEGALGFQVVRRSHAGIRDFSVRQIVADLEAYLLETSLYRGDPYFVFGIESLKILRDYLVEVLGAPGIEHSLKPVATVTCHKRMMVARLNYIGMQVCTLPVGLVQEWQALYREWRIIQRLIIAYDLTRKPGYLERALQRMDPSIEREYTAVQFLLETLRNVVPERKSGS